MATNGQKKTFLCGMNSRKLSFLSILRSVLTRPTQGERLLERYQNGRPPASS